jgi:hypothetical protein
LIMPTSARTRGTRPVNNRTVFNKKIVSIAPPFACHIKLGNICSLLQNRRRAEVGGIEET